MNLGFGAHLVAGKTGIVLNDEMDDFSLQPGVPNAFGLIGNEQNAIAPRKRPLSSMTPTIALDDAGRCASWWAPRAARPSSRRRRRCS